MLAAIQSCTLLDDVFQEDPATNDLEAYVASRSGKEAGLFVLSGTMGNQLALRSLLTQPPYSVLCDYRAHIYTSEAGGFVSHLELLPKYALLILTTGFVRLVALRLYLLCPKMADI